MDSEALVAFCIASFLLALSPGPGVMATVGRAVHCGFRQAVVLVLGLVGGDLVYLYFAVAGLTALGLLMGELFFLVRLACAAYLCWLGWTMLRDAGEPKAIASPAEGRGTYLRSFVLGFGVSLGNPKAILFYVSFVPTFVDVQNVTLMETIILSGVVLGVSLVVLGGYALIAIYTTRFAVRRSAAKRIDQLAGVTLIGAGALVAATSRP